MGQTVRQVCVEAQVSQLRGMCVCINVCKGQGGETCSIRSVAPYRPLRVRTGACGVIPGVPASKELRVSGPHLASSTGCGHRAEAGSPTPARPEKPARLLGRQEADVSDGPGPAAGHLAAPGTAGGGHCARLFPSRLRAAPRSPGHPYPTFARFRIPAKTPILETSSWGSHEEADSRRHSVLLVLIFRNMKENRSLVLCLEIMPFFNSTQLSQK